MNFLHFQPFTTQNAILNLLGYNPDGDEIPVVVFPSRYIKDQLETWYCAATVLKLLELDETFLRHVPQADQADEMPFSNGLEGDAEVITFKTAITEPALYLLAIISQKGTNRGGEKETCGFMSWLIRDVLPNIRKVGAHVEPGLVPTNKTPHSFAHALSMAAVAAQQLTEYVETITEGE